MSRFHKPVPLLHTCGCVLMRYEPTAPFAGCPVHGFGQEAIGAVWARDALAVRQDRGNVVFFPHDPSTIEGPRRCR